MPMFDSCRRSRVLSDLLASAVVFVVALPLSLGIALASGAPMAAGLIAAVVGGVLAGALAGAPMVVTGPAAGLTALVLQMVQQHGWVAVTGIGVMAGIGQLIMGAFRVGKLIEKVPETVVEGMLAAIGLLIFTGQLYVLAGLEPIGTFLENISGLSQAFSSIDPRALLIGLLGVIMQLLLPKLVGYPRWLPSVIPAVVFATLAGLWWEIPRVEFEPVLDTARGHSSQLFSLVTEDPWGRLIAWIPPALTLAIVASAETLLTARGVDKLMQLQGQSPPAPRLNQELFAQGTANVASGVLGGLPMTGVIVRSAVNVQAGGISRLSTILHGVWVAAFVLLFPGLLRIIPLSVLASVLVVTGVRLLHLRVLVHRWKSAPRDAAVVWATLGAIASTDLLRGLGVGLVCAAINKIIPPSRMRVSE